MNLLKCDKEVARSCPHKKACYGSEEHINDAIYAEGSDCDKYNRGLRHPAAETAGVEPVRDRAMSDYISREAAVTIADYAADEYPYDKDPKKPETYSDYNQGWNDACDYIRGKLDDEKSADVEPVQHWILCKDRPPKECGRYQAVVKSEAFTGSSYIDTLTYDKFGWRDGCCYINGVSHWMPLPGMPEG